MSEDLTTNHGHLPDRMGLHPCFRSHVLCPSDICATPVTSVYALRTVTNFRISRLQLFRSNRDTLPRERPISKLQRKSSSCDNRACR